MIPTSVTASLMKTGMANIGYFATNHYHITDAGGYNTYIGFPVAREEKDRKHDPEAGLKGRWIQTADGNWMFKMDDGFAKSMWVKVGQKWWYMNEDGYMHTGLAAVQQPVVLPDSG